MAKFDESALVVKSNKIVSAIFPKNLTPSEMDLLSVAFTSIKQGDDDVSIVRIRVQDLIRLYGIENSKSAYEQVFAVSRRLLSRVVEIKTDDGNELIQFHILSMAKYNMGGGFVDIKFDDELKPYLIDIKRRYTKYQIKYSLRLDSFYAKRIYELLVQYRGMQGKDRKWSRELSVSELRLLLGIPKKEYERFSNFRARVLNISVAQINERTDIRVECEEIKVGRSVESIKFTAIEKAEPPALLEVVPDPTAGRDFQRLLSYGIDDATARELVEKHPADVVGYNLEVLDGVMKSARGERIENPAGWLIAGIRSNRGEQLNLLNGPAPTQASKYDEAKRKEARKAELAEIIRGVMGAYREYRRKLVEAYLSAGDEEELKADFTEFMKSKIGPVNVGPLAFALGQFQKAGWFDTLAIPHVAEFFTGRGSAVMTIEEFATKKGVPNYGEISEELKQLEKGV